MIKKLAVIFILFSLISSCSTKSSKVNTNGKIEKVKEINVAVILPSKRKWEYREYKNERSSTYYNIKKGTVYVDMVRDSIEEAVECKGLIRDIMKKISKSQKIKVNLIDRSKINEILKEMKFQSSGLVNEKTASKIGKLLGASKIVFVEPRFISLKIDRYKDKIKIGIPLVREKGIVYCSSIGADVNVKVSVIDVSTAKIAFTKSYTGKSNIYKQCSKLGYRTDELPSPEKVIEEAINNVSGDFSSDFCSAL